MTKNDYLDLKQNDSKLQIMYIYHNENIGLANLTFDEFRQALHTHLKKNQLKQIHLYKYYLIICSIKH